MSTPGIAEACIYLGVFHINNIDELRDTSIYASGLSGSKLQVYQSAAIDTNTPQKNTPFNGCKIWREGNIIRRSILR